MKIYLPEVRQREGQFATYTFAGKIPAGFGPDPGSPGRLQVKADIRINGDKVFLEGVLSADIMANCSRCLKEYARHLEVDFKETFTLQGMPGPGENPGPAALAAEAANQLIVYGDYLYLEEYFRQVFLLGLGYRSLCRENCQGICPLCGIDLNHGSCDCTPEERIDPRLKALKDFCPRS
ncbi:MAG: hypothetical protein GX973_04335 [Firmicutes bacterium]|nr:hypothetical protein [Bacillota bacterium]